MGDSCRCDEFWIAREPGQTLRSVIEALSAHQPVQSVKRWNATLHRRHDRADWIDPVSVSWFDPQHLKIILANSALQGVSSWPSWGAD